MDFFRLEIRDWFRTAMGTNCIVMFIIYFMICVFLKFYLRLRNSCITEYKLGRLFLPPTQTVRHFFFAPPRQPATYCFLWRLWSILNGFLPRLREAGSRITRTASVRSHFSRLLVSEESKRSRTDSAEATYDGQSRQKAKTGRLVYNL